MSATTQLRLSRCPLRKAEAFSPFRSLVLSYYIYYRVARPGDAERKLARLQSAIQDALGVQGRVLRKRNEAALWMEIYERVPDAAAFEQLMDRLVTETGFDTCLQSGSRRTVECFEEA